MLSTSIDLASWFVADHPKLWRVVFDLSGVDFILRTDFGLDVLLLRPLHRMASASL
jgi:hypothetical protein